MATLKQQQHQKNCEISFLRRLFGLITALLLLRFSFGQKKNETNKKQSEKTHNWISCKGITLLTLDRLLWLFVDFNRGLQFILNPPSLPPGFSFSKKTNKLNTRSWRKKTHKWISCKGISELPVLFLHFTDFFGYLLNVIQYH